MPRTELEGVTPTLADTIRTLLDAVLMDVNVCLPAKVAKYYPETQYADVQVQLKRRYEDGTLKALPTIPNVPVIWPRSMGGKARVHLPLAVGDDLTLVFSQRSLDNWKTQGGMQDPADRRKFSLTDAIAFVGGSAEPDAFPVNDPTAIEVINDQGIVQIKPDGTVNLGAYAPSHAAALADEVENRLAALEQGLTQLVTDVTTLTTVYTAHIHNIVAPVPGTPVGPAIAPGVPPAPFVPDTSVIGSTKVKVVT